jgi:hypothetical protein
MMNWTLNNKNPAVAGFYAFLTRSKTITFRLVQELDLVPTNFFASILY